MSGGAGENKTLPERARARGHALHDAAGSAAGDRRATLFADGALLIELAVALEAAEAERAAAWGVSHQGHTFGEHRWSFRDVALVFRALGGDEAAVKQFERAEDAEARVEAVEAERDEAKRQVAWTMTLRGESTGLERDRANAAEARLVAVEAERDEALADSARGDNFKRQLRLATASLIEDRRAAEGRVVAVEAENAELKGLKAGGDRDAVAVAQADEALMVITGALALAYADLPCSNGCGCETFDYCAQDEIAKAQHLIYRERGVLGHDGMECEPGCAACSFAAEASRYRARCVALTDALRATIKAYDDADTHVREKLQPEFARMGETRLATWWHGTYDAVDHARAVLASSVKQEKGQELGDDIRRPSGGGS